MSEGKRPALSEPLCQSTGEVSAEPIAQGEGKTCAAALAEPIQLSASDLHDKSPDILLSF